MRIKQKISFLLADYAVRIIAARHFPELAKLESIRSIETAAAAHAAVYAAAASTAYYGADADAAYYAADAADAAAASTVYYAADADAAYYAANVAYYAANYTTSVMYANDIRALINIAIDPDLYW